MALFSFLDKPLVGIDIGAQTIKALQVSGSATRPRVKRFAALSTPEGCVVDGEVVDPEKLGRTIRSLVSQVKAQGCRAAVAVNGQSRVIRRLTLPRMPLDEVRGMLTLQMERYIPFAKEGAHFDVFQLDQARSSAPEMPLLVVAAPARVVDNLQLTFKSAGIPLALVDIDCLALFRALTTIGLFGEEESVGILDMASSTAKLSMFDRGIPILNKEILLEPEALELMRMPAGKNPDEALMSLYLEVRKAFEFALTLYPPGHVPSKIFVVGGGGETKGLPEGMTAYMKSLLSQRLPESFGVHMADLGYLRLPTAYTLALGLAIGQVNTDD